MKTFVLPLPQPYRLQIIEDDRVFLEKVLDANWDLVKKDLEIPGFEKGGVPRSVAEKKLGPQVLYQFAIKQITDKGIAESKLNVCEITEIQIDWYTDKQPLVVYATCLLNPCVVRSEYEALEFDYEKLSISELEIESQLHRLALSEANEIPSSDSIVMDDLVTTDFVITDTITKEKLGEQVDYQFRPAKSIYGFESAVVSRKSGESFKAETEIPKEFFNDALRGRAVVYDVTIKKVAKLDIPPIDDRLAQLIGFTDLNALKTSLRKDIKKEKEKADDLLYKDALYTRILEKTEITAIPDSLVKRELDNMLHSQLIELSKKQGTQITSEVFFKKAGVTKEQWQMMYWGRAVRKIKLSLLLHYVFEKEKLSITEEERQKVIDRVDSKIPRDQIDMTTIEDFLKKEKAQTLLLSKVVNKVSNG